MPKIPLFIMEEHHEAFYIWSYGYFNRLINPFGNTLLHVDAHSDMCVMGYRTSLDELEEDLEQVLNFVYSELGIADFLLPAVYQGVFNNITWLNNNPTSPGKNHNMYVASAQPEGKYFKTGEINNFLRPYLQKENNKWGKHQFFTYQELGLKSEFKTSQPLVLDIDIDYFCSDNSLSSVEKKIEITKEAYDEFRDNRYHFFRILPMASYSVGKEKGHFYLYYSEMQEEPGRPVLSSEMIIQRIHKFGEFLTKNQVEPKMIDLCRSRYSGYTPAQQWEFIESELLKVLKEIYDLDIHHIQDLT